MSRHPYQRNRASTALSTGKPKQATPVAPVDHVQPRVTAGDDPGFLYPDTPPCRCERPEPCDMPAATYRRGKR